jgi:hypothetical protein
MLNGLTALIAFAALTADLGSVDLAEILAPPPSADYTGLASSASALDGPFNGHQYAVWLSATPSDAGRTEGFFNREGFTRGYARSWAALSTKYSPGANRHNQLVETVEEYRSANGAQARYAGVVTYAKSGADGFVRELETSIPHAFGALIFGGFDYFVMFVKGNDVYIVRMFSDLDDLTAATVHQAQVQFDIAPAYTIPPGQWQDPQPPADNTLPAIKLGLLILKGSILGVVLIGRLLLFIFHVRRRPT